MDNLVLNVLSKFLVMVAEVAELYVCMNQQCTLLQNSVLKQGKKFMVKDPMKF